MDKESLIKARELIFKTLDNSKIKKQDKAELIMNLWLLLDEDNYEHDIDVLRRYSKPTQKKKRRL